MAWRSIDPVDTIWLNMDRPDNLMVIESLMMTDGPVDPERLVVRFLAENINLGLYSYNATLPAVALFIWRRSLIPALLGGLLSVPLTEIVPKIGLPALTAPFVLATWIVLTLGWVDGAYLRHGPAADDRR